MTRLTLALVLTASFAMASCSGGSSKAPRPLTIRVDPTLAPRRATLDGFDGGAPRPLATLTDDSGITADFVANELLVTTRDAQALQSFLDQAHGTIVQSLRPSDRDFPMLAPMYLVHVSPPPAQASAVGQRLRQVTPNATGALRVSNQGSLDLLMAAANVNAPAIRVALNLVPTSATLAEGTSREAASADVSLTDSYGGRALPAEAYVADSSQWSYMRRTTATYPGINGAPPKITGVGIQDIGVTEAWRAMAAAGKLSNKVPIALLDGGLKDTRDVPPGAIWISPPGQPNAAECPDEHGNGHPCPWHGTGTLTALMGVPDNGFGGAGPAGPVALPIIAPSPSDFWTYAKYFLVDLPALTVLRTRIMNLSFAVRIPEGVNWIVNLVADPLFAALRLTGTLVFAAAGNQNADVDETDDAGAFKVATWIPCQSTSVICVGALALDSLGRAHYSNWANTSTHASHANTVDIYGPGRVWIPAVTDAGQVLDVATEGGGTSVASPFVAGVAALIWASDPELSANEVESILMSTAHTDGSDGLVPRWVNAFGAVRKVLGKIPPTVAITSPPPDRRTIALGDFLGLDFAAKATPFDGLTKCCSYRWTSSDPLDGANGVLGAASGFTFAFTHVGQRTVTVTATDGAGVSGTASVVVSVTPAPPRVVSILQPTDGATLYVGASYALEGAIQFGDSQGVAACNLSTSVLRWTSSNPADALAGVGCEVPNVEFAAPGPRTLTLTYAGGVAAAVSASVTVNVVVSDAPVVADISLVIRGLSTSLSLSNATSRVFMTDADVITLEGQGQGGFAPLDYRWTWRDTSKAGCPETDISAGSTASWMKSAGVFNGMGCGTETGRLTLYLSDALGKTGSAWSDVTFSPPLP